MRDVPDVRAANATPCRAGLALRSASLLLPIVGLRAMATAAATARVAMATGFGVDEEASMACKRAWGDGIEGGGAAGGGLVCLSSRSTPVTPSKLRPDQGPGLAATRGKQRSLRSGGGGGDGRRRRHAMAAEGGGRRGAVAVLRLGGGRRRLLLGGVYMRCLGSRRGAFP